jgi:hypothetical protein
MRRFRMALLFFALVLVAFPALGKDAFYRVKLGDLRLTRGALPVVGQGDTIPWRLRRMAHPTVVLEGEGEAFVGGEIRPWNWAFDIREQGYVLVRAPAGRTVIGELRLPHVESGQIRHKRLSFRISPDLAGDYEVGFRDARRAHFQRLLDQGLPGAPWFRRLRDEGQRSEDSGELTSEQRRQRHLDDLSESYDLFSGGAALAENLQLDRALVPRGGSQKLVDIATLEGITVNEIDWSPLLPEETVALDGLADVIPADQHALFFPSFQAMTALMDEADGLGTPFLTLFEARSQDANVKGRYQTQLCLSMSHLARLMGPKIITSVAVTGSDPYLRLGSDIAVVFAATSPELVYQHIAGKQATAGAGQAWSVTGEMGGLSYQGVCSPDRRVCSYLLRSNDRIVVSNSLGQLKRIVETMTGQGDPLSGLPEYRFFRHRYPLGDSEETAFLLLPDAAIRRWCSPRWRIADSRRMRAQAVLSHYQALHLGDFIKGEVPDLKESAIGPLIATRDGYLSSTFGTLHFMTPILDMELTEVTEEEAESYRWFRDRYQRSWQEYFDPIAIRFYVDPDEISLDVSVIPLIAGSQYRELIELTTGKALAANAGDPHADALFRFGMSLNPESRTVRQASSFALSLAPGFAGNALSWLGDSMVLYGDEDRFWTELVRAPKKDDFFERNFHRLPVALRVSIASPMKATAFLTSVRGFIEQTAPNMTVWETRQSGDLSYVRVGPSTTWDDDLPEELAIYYAVAGSALTITLNEALLKRSLLREQRRSASKGAARRMDEASDAWQGKQVGFQATGKVLELAEVAAREELVPEIQFSSWGNIPILNEWHRLFPDQDPVAVHEQLWGVRLVCPGGGQYVWNEEWQTMESTIYGHPGAPTHGPSLLRKPLSDFTFGNFGLTFEDGGLRAKGTLYRSDIKRSWWLKRLVLRWLSRWPEPSRERLKLAAKMARNLLATLSANRVL